MENDETVVPAGNQLGKDFIAAYAALWFFLSRQSRVVTTSVKHDQLKDVLWGEISRFIKTSKHELPIRHTHLHVRRTDKEGNDIPLWELVGQVSNKDEGLLGRHLERGPFNEPTTMAIFDEASGIDTGVHNSTETWAHRKLIIGNTFPCTNFFYSAVKEGDQPRIGAPGFYRKVIRIKAEDSPNVRLGLLQVARGEEPTHEILIPGLKDYATYIKHRHTMSKVMQTISLDAQFYEGASILMYPPEWLNRSAAIAEKLVLEKQSRKARAIGVDTAEGGDSTVWTVVDEYGILEQLSMKTPDTSIIPTITLTLMSKWGVAAENVLFDRGGGGKQHADLMRKQNHFVRTISFGESASPEMRPVVPYLSFMKEVDVSETQMVFKNRRAQMYWLLRQLMDENWNPRGFGIPATLTELRKQLDPVPLLLGDEGQIYLPPKRRLPGSKSTQPTMTELVGCSPDEADSAVLAVFGLLNPRNKTIKVGAIS
jgi:hypothetical protein